MAVTNFRTASGAVISPANLSYTWMQDDTTLGSASGIGKSVAIVAAPLQYRSGDYSVIVTTEDGTEVGSGSVSLSPQDPTVRLYANDPLLGIRFDHALSGTFSITDPEAPSTPLLTPSRLPEARRASTGSSAAPQRQPGTS